MGQVGTPQIPPIGLRKGAPKNGNSWFLHMGFLKARSPELEKLVSALIGFRTQNAAPKNGAVFPAGPRLDNKEKKK